jgi:hypothetical protein
MSESKAKPSDDFKRFDDFTRKLMAVPKKEIDAAEKKYQRRKERAKKRAR